MVTVNGAKALGWEDEIGTLESGKKADIAIIDTSHVWFAPLNDVVSEVVYTADGQDVDTVIVDGKILMEDGVIKSLDEAEVLCQAQIRSDRIFAGDSL